MASSSSTPDPLLISVKAVDPERYPFYGSVKLNPAVPFRTVLQPDAVVVSDGVLLRMNAKVGDTIRIGGQPFRIAAEVTNEPDRMTGSLNVGPRVMMSRAAFEMPCRMPESWFAGINNRTIGRIANRTSLSVASILTRWRTSGTAPEGSVSSPANGTSTDSGRLHRPAS